MLLDICYNFLFFLDIEDTPQLYSLFTVKAKLLLELTKEPVVLLIIFYMPIEPSHMGWDNDCYYGIGFLNG
jgi:hypothetical protein